MAWEIRNFEPVYVDDPDEGEWRYGFDPNDYILGEHYDEYWGFDCDNYDYYDPFAAADRDYWKDSMEEAGYFEDEYFEEERTW